MLRVAQVSFRLGGTDGVSIEAAKWATGLRALGHDVLTVAGEGPTDVVVAELGMTSSGRPALDALDDVDVVIVENLCSIPLQPEALAAVAEALRGRPAVLRHHDLQWHHERLADRPPPPDDPAWLHVVATEMSRNQMVERGYPAERLRLLRYRYDANVPTGTGRRPPIDTARLVLQPTRAIARKNVAGGLELAERLGATYWLRGPVEMGYDDELAAILDRAQVPVLRGTQDLTIDEAYESCDVTAFPSTWEGFGNPPLEAALHHKPVLVGRYPVADELVESYGFRWWRTVEAIETFLRRPDAAVLEHNRAIVVEHFALDGLASELADLLASLP